jgi:hypothetical protein
MIFPPISQTLGHICMMENPVVSSYLISIAITSGLMRAGGRE